VRACFTRARKIFISKIIVKKIIVFLQM